MNKGQFITWYEEHENELAYTIDQTGFTFKMIPENGNIIEVWKENGKFYFEW